MKIDEVFRIKKRAYNSDALVPTWSVRLKFQGKHRPTDIYYGEETLTVSAYIPKPTLCAKCSKTGHHQHKCTNTPNCGFCGRRGHQKKDCRNVNPKDEPRKTKCPNCKEQHTAKYAGCQYLKIERRAIIEQALHQTPKHQTRRKLWSEVANSTPTYVPIPNIPHTFNNADPTPGTSTQLTPAPADFPPLPATGTNQPRNTHVAKPPQPPITNLEVKLMQKIEFLMEQINELKQKIDTLSKPEADSSSVIENPDQPTADVTINQNIPTTPKCKRTPTVTTVIDRITLTV